MTSGILGKKIGMTQVFRPDGQAVPVTLLKAGPGWWWHARPPPLVDQFKPKDKVDVIGVSKGRGFAGLVKRHHFGGGAATHGSMFHRAPGSIGASSFPSRVVKGMRAAGRMGGTRITTHNLKVLRVDADNHLLIVEGSVPGAPESYVTIRKAIKAKRIKVAQVEKPKKGKK